MADTRVTLLLVDDDPDVLELLEETFTEAYDVVTARSGGDALEILRSRRVDLLITDQRMPGMSGAELIERAKAADPDLLCVILTGHSDPADLISAVNTGHVYRFVTKPFRAPQLIETVRAAVAELGVRRESVQRLADAQRRSDALEAMVEMGNAAGAQSTYGDIVDVVTAALERVAPLDVSATLVRAERARPAALTLRARTTVDEAELRALKEEVQQRYRALTGDALADSDVLVRVTGRPPPAAATGRRLSTRRFVPLRAGGEAIGVLAIAAQRDTAAGEVDAALLDVFADRAAELIDGLRARIDDERSRMNRMVEGMADGLIMTDAAGEVVVENSAARALLAVPEGQPLTSKYLREALSFYPFELVRGWERRGGHAVSEDVEVGGRVLRSLVRPVTGAGGRLTGVVVVLRDVSDDRHGERKKEDFVADVSHELRTPLTAISGALDLVLNHAGPLSEKQTRYITLARGAATRLNSTIDDLLDLSRAAREGLKPALELRCLDEIVAQAAARFEPAFHLAGVQVIHKRPAEPVRMLLDEARIAQVLNNLLANALKFTPKGTRVEVETFRLPDVAGMAGFAVSNEGSHIPEEDQERIFQQYPQAKGGRVRGTGLGLPISRTIIEAHNGRIWVESAPHKGVRFIAVLPVEATEYEATPVIAHPPAPGPVLPVLRARSTSRSPPPPPRVLVVDDDRATGYALKGVLLGAGYAVDLCHSAADALTVARRTRPSAFLVDVCMPGVDGAQLIEILRHDPETRSALIVAMSAPDQAARGQRAGAHASLQKPVDAARLTGTLAALIHARREGARVLVVDDDPAMRALCGESLRALGYSVAEAGDAHRAIQQVAAFRPDLILLDVLLPDKDGFQLLEELKADRTTSHISVIFISARSETRAKVTALQLGGDDYVVKPFDALELCARVETVLRRRDAEASPTTMLPSSSAIDRAVSERIKRGGAFTLGYLDLDNLKAFNDYYGYAKADGVVHQTGDLLRAVMAEHGSADDFLGHIAGDDFVFITSPERANAIGKSLIDAFDRIIPLYYNREDRERGYIETDDRYGDKRRFPIMSVSVVAVTDPGGRFKSHSDIAAMAAGLKQKAKSQAGSVFLVEDGARRATA